MVSQVAVEELVADLRREVDIKLDRLNSNLGDALRDEADRRAQVQSDVADKSKELRDLHSALQVMRGELSVLKGFTQTNKREIEALKAQLVGSKPSSNISLTDIFADPRFSEEIRRQVAELTRPQQDKIAALEEKLRTVKPSDEILQILEVRMAALQSREDIVELIEDRLARQVRDVRAVQETTSAEMRSLEARLAALQSRDDVIEIIEDRLGRQLRDQRAVQDATIADLRTLEGRLSALMKEQRPSQVDPALKSRLEDLAARVQSCMEALELEKRERRMQGEVEQDVRGRLLDELSQQVRAGNQAINDEIGRLNADQRRQDDIIGKKLTDSGLAARDLAALERRLAEVERRLREVEAALMRSPAPYTPSPPPQQERQFTRRSDSIHPDLNDYSYDY
mmetsp:Transcript_44683/g.106021  ORF Transcript_44683/g.106021 Transcript_44683/m.106021 type:complete len:397 (+) Transcript_44683:113-1303(+)